ncbi:MAG: HAD family phosphatase [Sporichthyaceae bacterium]|nr:HAD family phosphatase [Sporichthyaceae bacterium]
MSIKAVVFDIGGVLERVGGLDWTGSWLTRLGLGQHEFEAALAQVDPDGQIEIGRMTEQQYRQRYAEVLALTDDQLDAFMSDMWNWYCGELDVELMTFADSLRPAYRTAILSNSADGARREEQARYGFADVFDPIIYSHEVGLAKPDPRIYSLTCERMGLEPQEVVLLDDVAANVEGAHEIGMHAVLWKDMPESIAAVRALLEDRD